MQALWRRLNLPSFLATGSNADTLSLCRRNINGVSSLKPGVWTGVHEENLG
jgi:hypothetical protein